MPDKALLVQVESDAKVAGYLSDFATNRDLACGCAIRTI
jgi:hypothetical protein